MNQTYRPYPTALLNPCADPIFKILFTDSSKESNIALTCFLTDIIGKKVSNVVLQPNELSGETNTDKQSEFDINCKIDGKIVNIEMQGLNKDNHFGRRAEYHVAHLYNHYVTKGLDWTETPQVFQISVLNFIFDDSEKDCISYYLMRNQNGRTIAGMLNVIFMELPKIEPVPDDISLLTPVQMWGKFFLYADDPKKWDFVKKLAEQNRGIKMAVTVLKNISQDEINWYHQTRYWMHVSDEKTMINEAERKGIAKGLAEGMSKGLAEGISKGHAEGLAAAVLGFHKNGASTEFIANSLNMTEEQVQEIISKNPTQKA